MDVLRAWCGCCLGTGRKEAPSREASEYAPLLQQAESAPGGPVTRHHPCLFPEPVVERILQRLRTYVHSMTYDSDLLDVDTNAPKHGNTPGSSHVESSSDAPITIPTQGIHVHHMKLHAAGASDDSSSADVPNDQVDDAAIQGSQQRLQAWKGES